MNKFTKHQAWEKRAGWKIELAAELGAAGVIILTELAIAGVGFAHLLLPIIGCGVLSYFGFRRGFREDKLIFADVAQACIADGLVASDWAWTAEREQARHSASVHLAIKLGIGISGVLGIWMFGFAFLYFWYQTGLSGRQTHVEMVALIISLAAGLLFGRELVAEWTGVDVFRQGFGGGLYGHDPYTAEGQEKLSAIYEKIYFFKHHQAVLPRG